MAMKKFMTGGIAVIAVCVAGLLAAGCGGSSPTPSTAATTPAATATTTPATAASPAPSPSAAADQYAVCLSAGTCTSQQQKAIAAYNGMTDAAGTNGCLVGGACTPDQQRSMYGSQGVRIPGVADQYAKCLSAGTCTSQQQEAIAQYNGMTDAAGTNGCLVGGGCTPAQQRSMYGSQGVRVP